LVLQAEPGVGFRARAGVALRVAASVLSGRAGPGPLAAALDAASREEAWRRHGERAATELAAAARALARMARIRPEEALAVIVRSAEARLSRPRLRRGGPR
jgi:hypothetical protein